MSFLHTFHINYQDGYYKGKKVIDAIREAGVFYTEGLMYRCHPQIPALLDLIKKDNQTNEIEGGSTVELKISKKMLR